MEKMRSVEIKRAIRDFSTITKDYLESNYGSHRNNLDRFFAFIDENKIIKQIIDPLMALEIDFDRIFTTRNGGFWIDKVEFPLEKNVKIGAVLQLLKMEKNKEISFESISTRIYPSEKNIPRLLQRFNNEIIGPGLRDLFTQLSDFVEDELESQSEVQPSVLNIFYGNITAQQGANVAIGNHIKQTANYKSIAEKIMEQVTKDSTIEIEKHEKIEKISEEVEAELKSAEPDKSKLKSLVGKFFEVGQNGLLKLTKTVIEDPRWSDAISNFFLDS